MTDKSNPNDPYRGEHPENFPDSGNQDSSSYGSEGPYSQGSSQGPSQGSPDQQDTSGYGTPQYGAPQYGSSAGYGTEDNSYGANSYGANSYGDNTYGAGYPGGNQAGYQAGYPGAYPGGVAEKNNMALWAMILGIIALLLVVTIALFPVGSVLGIVAVVLGILGIRRGNRMVGPEKRKGMAITGLVTGILAILASIAIVLMVVAGLTLFEGSGALDCIVHLEGDNPNQAAYEQCVTDAINSQTN
ncbi:hypothetical protein [Corynebacterium lubricantis]|uniref:hypothetical protein n=1 Tax=Corynebacterium lubricantis TaxID=541095 RepID=UPI00036F3F34|nr:hypothetical protein [Corynebacterium lubricantis]